MKKYTMLDKNKVRKEILKNFKDSDFNSSGLCICNLCKMNCYNGFKNKQECFQPMRELYDEKYALEG